MKTQKASDSFVWVGFIASWFVTSPALTSQLHLGLISHVCFKTYHAKRSQKRKADATEFPERELLLLPIVIRYVKKIIQYDLNIMNNY